MQKVTRFLRKFWWAILLGVGVLFTVLWWLLDRSTPSSVNPPKPTFSERAKNELERVRLEGELEKARVTAQADVKRAELDVIESVGKDNPAEGRRQLSSWLRDNL